MGKRWEEMGRDGKRWEGRREGEQTNQKDEGQGGILIKKNIKKILRIIKEKKKTHHSM